MQILKKEFQQKKQSKPTARIANNKEIQRLFFNFTNKALSACSSFIWRQAARW
jgi:hypothetical protein